MKLIAFNITNNKFLLNKTKYPILYYKSDDTNIEEELKKQEDFKNFLGDTVFSINHYSFAELNYFVYENLDDNIEGNEKYFEYSLKIQKLFKLSEINNDFYKDYILTILADLYKQVFKEEYDCIINSLPDEIIKDINEQLSKKFINQIENKTIENYIISQLQEKYIMDYDNIQYIIENYNKIIS